MIVAAKGLGKSFTFQKRDKNLPFWRAGVDVTVQAVTGLTLTIAPGERVAFVGPNGAGKSTTIKMLSGILTPSSGTLSVCGLDPVRDRRILSHKIGCVFGQRSQLLPNLPLRDSFELFGRMYDLPHDVIAARSAELMAIFALESFIDQPVRQLSLGQRMRGEIAASLLHRPEIIFLDEPTIGLDVVAKRDLRRTLLALNECENTTIFLTSHDTGDIEALSQRMIVIDHGRVIIDAPTRDVHKTWLSKKYIRIEYDGGFDRDAVAALGFAVVEQSASGVIDTNARNLNDVLQSLLAAGPVADLHLQDESLEDVIIDIYKGGGQ